MTIPTLFSSDNLLGLFEKDRQVFVIKIGMIMTSKKRNFRTTDYDPGSRCLAAELFCVQTSLFALIKSTSFETNGLWRTMEHMSRFNRAIF